MKKILLPILSLILAACSSSQVAVTRSTQVTVTSSPPPTATPIPTPTLHPQFVALQSQIAASGETFTLLPNGTIEQTTSEGAITVPGLFVDKNGTITLQGDSLPAQAGSQVTISPEDVSFDDTKGVSVKGYTLDEATGKWEPAVPTAETAAIALFDKYSVAPDTYTLAEVDGVIVGTDNETGTEIFRDGRFEISYAVELAKKDCKPTDIEPSADGLLILYQSWDSSETYISEIMKDLNFPPDIEGWGLSILIDREKQCWVWANSSNIYYRDETGLAKAVPIINLTEDEMVEFIINR